jgi:hypothetical protein
MEALPEGGQAGVSGRALSPLRCALSNPSRRCPALGTYETLQQHLLYLLEGLNTNVRYCICRETTFRSHT